MGGGDGAESAMPLYTFESNGRQRDDIRWTNLSDHGWAHRHAHLIIQELKDHPNYHDPGLKIFGGGPSITVSGRLSWRPLAF